MSPTSSEDCKEFTTSDAYLLVISTILASHGSTPITGLDAREQIEANNDYSSMTSGQSHSGPQMETAEASETTMTPRQSVQVRRVPTFFSPGLNYVNYIDAGKPCTFHEACSALDAELWGTTIQSKMDSIYANDT